jgi:hypothetical protein
VAAASIDLDLRPLRYVAGAMLGAAVVRPHLGDPGVACPLRSLTGVPCPLCGMTRGVTAMVHGDIGHALLMNPGSVLLVAAAVAVLVARHAHRVQFPAWALYLTIAALWAFQLFKLFTGAPM